MKKIVSAAFVAALLCSAGAAQAQLSAGHIMLTGSAGYSSDKDGVGDDSYTRTTGEISPQVGYFVADNLAIGIGLSYGGVTTKDEGENPLGKYTRTISNTSMTVGPFARYYKPVGDHAAFFGQLGVGFGSTKRTEELEGKGFEGQTADEDIKYSLLGAQLSPGFTFFPTDHFGLEISMGGLGYNKTKQKDKPDGAGDTWEDDNTATGFDFNLGLQGLTIGATWYLGGK